MNNTQNSETTNNLSVGLSDLLERRVQSVIITFDDGTTAIFSGRVACKKSDTRIITDIKFTEPKDLPNNCSWMSF